ncbi:sensor histidine kinase [Pseudozobellia thermophila]|uniref:histidine kinase n=1 Tax=Pseudozobellia thermophila TaxID=192903 RepID=A0A1M6JVB1_9FLAO|nr:sensor histidine kinase [Pseudozobellia thermophila]SHJ50627.1 Two-component sensor histidine kinase, contains HisKA and HATPase domains [Pseudozobellia thermophila]
MKLKFTNVKLILFSLILFLVTNILIWSSIVRRIGTFNANMHELEEVKAHNRIKEAENQFISLYEISKKNIAVIRKMVQLEIENGDKLELIAKKLGNFIELDGNYFQARIIDSNGYELTRAQLIGNSTYISDPGKLQYKGDRYYFKEALNIDKGQIYVSQLDLNIENGKVEVPYRPTVRFFSPLYVQDKKIGIIGLNLDIKNWFDTFKGKNVGLLNANNEVFYDDKRELYGEFKEDLDKEGAHGHKEFFYKKISLDGDQFWTLYTQADISGVEQKLADFKKEAVETGILLSSGVLILLVITYSMNRKNIKISKLNERIESRLKERDTLIKEIHHRVKNNLQVVASLLSLQSSFIKDETIKMLFRYSQYRINSMGMVHEMLYRSGDLSKIDYGGYIKELVGTLIQSMRGKKSKIELITEVDNIYLNLDTSIPLGLIINEIITNSLKYGFKDSENGTIFIKLDKIDSSAYKYRLEIGDNGSGFPPNVNFRNTKSLGLKLIHKLVLQLRGNIEKDNSKVGTHYIITFKEIEQIS